MTLLPASGLVEPEVISINDIVTLGATNSEVFARHFFPKTLRQTSPQFHKIMWNALDDPTQRYVNFKCFRGSAKTTILRLFTAKRIAYGISRTILYVGASEPHAIRSIRWIKNAIVRNQNFSGTFGLRQGTKWTDTEIEVYHELDERPIWLLGAGITGNVRGINFDDYRPDLIILDDTITDENAATLEQREKTNDLILGALKESLTPATEEPNAKLANLQTPLHSEDAAAKMAESELFRTYTFSCFTPETDDLPVDQQESSWPERYPTETLRAEKLLSIKENRYSKWARENECKLITAELASFRAPWLGKYDVAPAGTANVLVIDPVPPPTPRQQSKGLVGKDFEAHVVVGRKDGDFYALDVRENRGHEPNWTIATALELAHRFRVMRICIIAVGYEVVLESMFRIEMARRRVYHAIVMLPTQNRTKFNRITAALSGPASQGHVHVNPRFSTLITQFQTYGPTYSGKDDALEAFAAGVDNLANPYLELGGDEYSDVTASQSDDNFHMRARAP